MLLKGFIIILSSIIVAVAIIGYQPMPEGLENPIKVQLFMGLVKLGETMRLVRKLFGYGGKYRDVRFPIHQPHRPEEVPASATYGELKVTREKIAGVSTIIYQPKAAIELYPAIIFFHGGGWVIEVSDVHDKCVYEYAKQTGTVMINVEYRLAPEHPFPAPFQDCLDVTQYILRHGANYGIDVTKVGVAGDSAGGNLAAAVALKLTKEKLDLPPLLFQILHFPAMQAFDMHLPSYIDLNQTMPILKQDMMSAFYAFYMGVAPAEIDYYTTVISENRHIPPALRKSRYAEFVDVKLLPRQYQTPAKPAPVVSEAYDEKVYTKIKDVVTDPFFSPLMSPDLAGLPPAFIHICEFDVLRDDGFLYARRLQDAGVKVSVHFGKGGFHGDTALNVITLIKSGNAALSAAYAFVNATLGR